MAIDLDGTLIRRGSIAAIDREAVRDALSRGVVIVLATGRLSSGMVPLAGELGVEAPVVCADGSVITCARDGTTLERATIHARTAFCLVRELVRHRLTPYIFLDDAICCEPEGRALASLLSGWSRHIIESERFEMVFGRARRDARRDAIVVLGIGSAGQVEAAGRRIERRIGRRVAVSAFPLDDGPHWAVRVQGSSASKGSALLCVANRLGLDAHDSAAIGDWYNDVSMFEVVGRSFAMGHAPDVVRRAASDVLDATDRTGGGVAEALARWLG